MSSRSNHFIQARSELWKKCKYIGNGIYISPGYEEDMKQTQRKRRYQYKGKFITFENNNSLIEVRLLDKRSRKELVGQKGLFPTKTIPKNTIFRLDGIIVTEKEYDEIGHIHEDFSLDFHLDDSRTYVIIPTIESKWRFANDPTKKNKTMKGNANFGAWCNSKGWIVPYIQTRRKINIGDGQILINYGKRYWSTRQNLLSK